MTNFPADRVLQVSELVGMPVALLQSWNNERWRSA